MPSFTAARRALTLLPAFAACAAAACGDTSAPSAVGWTGTVDTLETGRVVVHNRSPVLEPGEQWTVAERFRLGSLTEEGPELFAEIYDMEWGPDGALYVLDNQANEVRVFEADGTHRMSFGREGQGPGEFNAPLGMDFGPDGYLWVMSRANARYSAFDPATGELVTERPRIASFVVVPWRGGFDRAGRFYDVGLASDGETALLGLDADFRPSDTLHLPTVDESRMIPFRDNGLLVMTMRDPFASAPEWAVHAGGGMVVGEGESYRIHHVEFGGDTVSTVELEIERTPVTSAEADSALAAFEDRVKALGTMVPDRDPRIPEYKPVHGPLFMDEEGRLWVARVTDEPGASWDVFDAQGRYLTPVSIPIRPAWVVPAVSGTRMAVAADLDGVPSVIVYDIAQAGGG